MRMKAGIMLSMMGKLDDVKETVKITASDKGMDTSPRPRKKCKATN